MSHTTRNHVRPALSTVSSIRLDELMRGDLAILPELLQQINLIDEFRSTVIDVIGAKVSPSVAQDVQQAGFERLHEFVPPYLLPRLIGTIAVELHPLTVRLFRKMVLLFESRPQRLFLAGQTWVRIMMPADLIADYRDTLSSLYGHAVVHNPHRDSWFSQAIGSINVWIALGRVRRDNSILIYPEVLGKSLERSGHSVARGQPIGVPLSFDLNVGDALLFSGEHLHSSALNVTDETRFVVSLRFTAEQPRYLSIEKQTMYYEI